jgi:3-phosphoshikimate 1-carboxyvinyltransferase
MGVHIQRDEGQRLRIDGVGDGGLQPPAAPLDLGNSGTSCRLLAGLLVGQRCPATLTGDESLRRRPMERLAAPLRSMGAVVTTTSGRAPIRIGVSSRLTGIEYELPVASAQLKSALLLAGLGAKGRTTVHTPGVTRDHTERMLSAMGAPLSVSPDGRAVTIDGPSELKPIDIDVPGDLSSAAFLLVAALLGASGRVTLHNVGVNPTRDGVLRILNAMGAKIELVNARSIGTEPVADIVIERSALEGIAIPPEWVPLAIDEFPVICVAAAAAAGKTIIEGADELRLKESDRIATMARALSALGIRATEKSDGLVIEGGRLRAGTVDSHGDHRIAMAMTVGALVSDGPLEILDTANVATSFPDFADTARALGLQIEVLPSRAA